MTYSIKEMAGALVFFLILFVVVPAIVLGIVIPTTVTRNRYYKFVDLHSLTLNKLREINTHYQFKTIPSYDMTHSYDNVDFYNEISCQDYLTYQLVYMQKQINQALKDTLYNKDLYKKYSDEIRSTCRYGEYDTNELLHNKKRLDKIERKLTSRTFKKPRIEYSIKVKLVLTNINDDYKTSKVYTFEPAQIKTIMARVNQRNGRFYRNDDIWQSICRVERGKVSNKMRFAIYNRDHNRCRKCGSTRNLEIDHIIPIAKGGKSTYDNLQTLCHRCNVNKGTKIE